MRYLEAFVDSPTSFDMIKLFAVICVVACVYGLPQPQPDEPVPDNLTPFEGDNQVLQAFVAAEAQPEDDLSGAESRWGGGGWGHGGGGGGWGRGGGWGGRGHGGYGHGGYGHGGYGHGGGGWGHGYGGWRG